MSVWKETKLGNLGRVVTGKTPSKDNPEDWGTEVLFVTPSDYKNYGKFANSSIRMLSNVGAKRQGNRLLPKGSILVTCIGSDMGKTAINSEPCVTNQQINAIIPDNAKANSDFIYYLTKDLYETLSSLGSDGTAVPILNKSDFENIDISIPALEEQKAIASVLSSLDDKIDLLHRQNTTLERMAETLFRQWFVEEAQEDWEEYKFKEIVQHVKPGTNYQPKRLESGIPFLNVRNLKDGFLDLSDVTYISVDEYQRVHKVWKPEENDVLISRIGTLGIVAVISKRDLPVAVHYNMINTKAKLTSYQFLYFLLKSQYFQELYSSQIRQSVQEYVAIEDIENLDIKLPLMKHNFKERELVFNDLYQKLAANEAQKRTLEKLRDNLLPKLISGEIRMQNG